jgi:hypothetical protein
MLLSYLIGLGILAYIVYRFSRAYDSLALELREIRVKCVGGGGNVSLPERIVSPSTGVVVDATKRLAGAVERMAGAWK